MVADVVGTVILGPLHEDGTRDLYFLPGSGSRWYKTRLILCACRTVGFNRFRRLRGKNLHNFESKKSRNGLLEVKLQHKVQNIFGEVSQYPPETPQGWNIIYDGFSTQSPFKNTRAYI